MTDITAIGVPRVQRRRMRERVALAPLPDPVPNAGPVLIGDCATPCRGETMLLAILRRMVSDDPDRDAGPVSRSPRLDGSDPPGRG